MIFNFWSLSVFIFILDDPWSLIFTRSQRHHSGTSYKYMINPRHLLMFWIQVGPNEFSPAFYLKTRSKFKFSDRRSDQYSGYRTLSSSRSPSSASSYPVSSLHLSPSSTIATEWRAATGDSNCCRDGQCSPLVLFFYVRLNQGITEMDRLWVDTVGNLKWYLAFHGFSFFDGCLFRILNIPSNKPGQFGIFSFHLCAQM